MASGVIFLELSAYPVEKGCEHMDNVIVEIPEGETWEPPALTEAQPVAEEPPEPAPSAAPDSAADVFFMQYAVCILLLTAVLVLRVLDASTFGNTLETFRNNTACPDEPWVTGLFRYIGSLWS